MTSKTSLRYELQGLLRNRQWPLVLGLILYFLHQVVGVFLALSGIVTAGRAYGISDAVLRTRKLGVLSDHFGCGNAATFFAVILGIVLAVQGFAYLDDRRQIDFYESQPIGRKRRFLEVNGSSILIFLFSSFSMKLLGLLAAFCMQAMSLGLLLTALYQGFRDFCLFFGIYGLTTLVMMLCGNVLIALLGTGFLLSAECVTRILQSELRLAFYQTVYSLGDGSGFRVLSSPIYYYIKGQDAFSDTRVVFDSYGYEMTMERLRQYVHLSLGWDLRGLLLALVLLLLAYLAYRKRPNEAAGCAVVFRPVQLVLKLAVTVLGGLCTGCFVYYLLGSYHGRKELLISLLMIALLAFLLGCFMEVIYNMNLRAAFRHARELVPCVLLALLAYSYYCFDLSGYDRYVPKREEVLSAQLFLNDDVYASEVGGYLDAAAYLQSAEEEKDDAVTDSVLQIAKIGMQYTRSLDTDLDQGYRMNVLYTLKNGERKARTFVIPRDIDAGLMDTVVGSESYHRERWQLTGYPFEAGHGAYTKLCYYVDYNDAYNGDRRLQGSDELLAEFREAYEKDVQQYSFSFAHNSYAIGRIELKGDQAPEDAYPGSVERGYRGSLADFQKDYENRSGIWTDNYVYYSVYNLYYEVYPSYTNTIAFLEKYGLYLPAVPEASEVAAAEVQNLGTIYDDNGEAAKLSTEDPTVIAQLLPNLVSRDYNGHFHTTEQFDGAYTVHLELKSQDNAGDAEATENAENAEGAEETDSRPSTRKIQEADYRYLADKVPAVVTEKLQ